MWLGMPAHVSTFCCGVDQHVACPWSMGRYRCHEYCMCKHYGPLTKAQHDRIDVLANLYGIKTYP